MIGVSNKNFNPFNDHEEYQYIKLLERIIDEGDSRMDRTGTGTVALFGEKMEFNLKDDVFPLLTTKTLFWRGIVEELLWMIKGSTNSKLLSDKGVKIWNGNSSRDFLDKRGLKHYEEGDLGPIYGFQWRHWGAKYEGMNADYTGKGIDQLQEVIDKIKTNPYDRRILMSAWNPSDLSAMSLPPCHMFCQFFVRKGELDCLMYQRSCDMGLGVPFNIASYALLTRLIAQVTNLKPGVFKHVLGDTHIYSNHLEPIKEQLKRDPKPFPKLKINPNVKNIEDFKFEDFELLGYDPHPSIKMEMST